MYNVTCVCNYHLHNDVYVFFVNLFTATALCPQHHTRGLTAQLIDPNTVVVHLSTCTVPQTHHTP